MPKCEIFEKIQVRSTTLQIFIGFSLHNIVFWSYFTFFGIISANYGPIWQI